MFAAYCILHTVLYCILFGACGHLLFDTKLFLPMVHATVPAATLKVPHPISPVATALKSLSLRATILILHFAVTGERK